MTDKEKAEEDVQVIITFLSLVNALKAKLEKKEKDDDTL